MRRAPRPVQIRDPPRLTARLFRPLVTFAARHLRTPEGQEATAPRPAHGRQLTRADYSTGRTHLASPTWSCKWSDPSRRPTPHTVLLVAHSQLAAHLQDHAVMFAR